MSHKLKFMTALLITTSFSQSEENYLKAIFKINEDYDTVTTNAVSAEIKTTAASVTDMLKKLSDKNLVSYEKYHGVQLTKKGESVAKVLIRKHRLWEVFLVDKLGYHWDEVHEIAEQLEHIQSETLIDKLEAFLGLPKFDPHGDPIPDAKGNIPNQQQIPLSELKQGERGVIVGVKDSSSKFLRYLDSIHVSLGSKIEVIEYFEYDNSRTVLINGKKKITLSNLVGKNLFIKTGKKK